MRGSLWSAAWSPREAVEAGVVRVVGFRDGLVGVTSVHCLAVRLYQWSLLQGRHGLGGLEAMLGLAGRGRLRD